MNNSQLSNPTTIDQRKGGRGERKGLGEGEERRGEEGRETPHTLDSRAQSG